MNSTSGRKILAACALLGLGLTLGACGGGHSSDGALWGVDMSRGVQLPPSEFPGPNNNPPPMPPETPAEGTAG